MSKWAWFWLTWLAAGIGLELYTVYRPAPGDTLSEQVWGLIAAHGSFAFIIGGFLIWLTVHFLRGWDKSWLWRRFGDRRKGK